MVHGGLRYLQQREFRLVYENLAERQRLSTTPPTWSRPLPFLIPLFGRDGVVSKAVARSYCDGPVALRRHRRAAHRRPPPPGDQAEALAHLPTLQHRPPGGRLPVLRRPGRRRPAHPDPGPHGRPRPRRRGGQLHAGGRPHRRPSDGHGANGRPWTRSPRRAPRRRTRDFDIRATVVVNATGVWADDVRALDEGAHPRSIRPAKGIHVTVPGGRLPARHRRRHPGPQGPPVHLRGAMARDGPRLPRDDRHRLRRVRSTTRPVLPEDVDYLLDAANAVTTSHLTARRRHRASGPACAPPGPRRGRPASRSAPPTSRAATPCATSPHGVVTVTGGKLTTYRQDGRRTRSTPSCALLGEPPGARRCVTTSLRLPRRHVGHAAIPSRWRRPTVSHLLGRYGTDAPAVLALADDRPELLEPVDRRPALPRSRGPLRRPPGDGADRSTTS